MATDRVVYTCVTGSYDHVRAPAGTDGWRFVCFTDTPGVAEEPWEEVPVTRGRMLGDIRRSRFHKVRSDVVLDAEVSLWLDGNIELLVPPDALLPLLDGHDLVTLRHPERDCIFAEARAVVEFGRDHERKVWRQMARYRRRGYPSGAGLVTSCVVLRRHTPAVRSLGQAWWKEIRRGSRRDQLSFNYVAHRLGFRYGIIDVAPYPDLSPYFGWRPHGTK